MSAGSVEQGDASADGHAVDANGQSVLIGDRVWVVSLPPLDLDDDAVESQLHLESMIGESLVVYDVDEWGRAWVQKEASQGNLIDVHSLALEAANMLLVDPTSAGDVA